MKKKLVSMMVAGALALVLAAPGYAARTYTPAWLEREATLEGAQNAGTPLTAVNKGGKWGYVDWRGRWRRWGRTAGPGTSTGAGKWP